MELTSEFDFSHNLTVELGLESDKPDGVLMLANELGGEGKGDCLSVAFMLLDGSHTVLHRKRDDDIIILVDRSSKCNINIRA